MTNKYPQSTTIRSEFTFKSNNTVLVSQREISLIDHMIQYLNGYLTTIKIKVTKRLITL